MPPTADLQIVTVVLQAGAFGLLLVASVWIGRYLVPKAFETYENMQARHAASFDEQETRHAAEKLRRDTTFEKLAESMTTLSAGMKDIVRALGDVVDRLEDVERRTDEHPMPPKKRS